MDDIWHTPDGVYELKRPEIVSYKRTKTVREKGKTKTVELPPLSYTVVSAVRIK